jgi:prepilin-type N-terminal cleavage/methylation domain-containing protein
MPAICREDGFTLAEMLVAATIMLLVTGAALTTFKQAVDVNAVAGQLGDTNQNLRAGTNQLVRDLMMAGRIIANGGVPAPSGTGATPISRPGPSGSALTFALVADDDGTLIVPAITPGYRLGPTINGVTTDIITILTVDEFMPVLQGIGSGTPTGLQAQLNADASQLTLPSNSPWLVGDATASTQPINVGDLVLLKNANGMAMLTVTSKDSTHVNFTSGSPDDWFHFNQRGSSLTGTIYCIKTPSACDVLPVASSVTSAAWNPAGSPAVVPPAIFRALMITYYVDSTTTPGSPRLVQVTNHFAPQALAGIVEDLRFSYDLVDASLDNVQNVPSLPYTLNGLTYTSNMVKKVNVNVGVRSETMTMSLHDYVRNHISTSVGVRSLASVDRYDTNQ